MVLQLESVNSYYGKSHIPFDLSLEVREGHSVCLLGRNNVGKSTTMKSVMGMPNPKAHATAEGKTMFNGQNICGLNSYKVAQAGIAYVPQGRHIFPALTTKENLLIVERVGVGGQKDWTLERIYGLFLRSKERGTSKDSKLSGGEQQMLAVARGLMQDPRLLLTDETMEGLASIIVQQLAEIMQELIKQKATILLAEQSIKFVPPISKDCYILGKDSVVHHEPTKDLTQETVQKYLGA